MWRLIQTNHCYLKMHLRFTYAHYEHECQGDIRLVVTLNFFGRIMIVQTYIFKWKKPEKIGAQVLIYLFFLINTGSKIYI